jgi:hypothetical protein
MKKKTVITTESFEVWIVSPSSDVAAEVAQAPEGGSWKPESSSESLTPVLEEDPDKDVPPSPED